MYKDDSRRIGGVPCMGHRCLLSIRMPGAGVAASLPTVVASGEELDQQLVDAIGLVVMHPVRRVR